MVANRYSFDEEDFKTTFQIDNLNDGEKFKHKQTKVRIFPFTTKNDHIINFDYLVGNYLCAVENITPAPFDSAQLTEALIEDEKFKLEISKDEFKEIIDHLFYNHWINQKNKNVEQFKPINLQFMEQIYSQDSHLKNYAGFLCDVLGEKDQVKNIIENAKKRGSQRTNILEEFVESHLNVNDSKAKNKQYFKITNMFNQVFEEDLKFVLSSKKLTKQYLIALLESYFFNYCIQTILILNDFTNGERKGKPKPIYYCLETEKTSQSRECYKHGWKMIDSRLKSIFAHANVLELINQTGADNSQIYDYIQLGKIVKNDPEEDKNISKQIDHISEIYHQLINSKNESLSRFNSLKKNEFSSLTESSIRFLFESVKVQFEESNRRRPYNSYADNFRKFSNLFLKSRGRNGNTLNITEEYLIFLTRISIKDKKSMRLVEVFNEFEKRGIFLDNNSKSAVIEYYEKLNIIEKKSDSGDAMYVRQLL